MVVVVMAVVMSLAGGRGRIIGCRVALVPTAVAGRAYMSKGTFGKCKSAGLAGARGLLRFRMGRFRGGLRNRRRGAEGHQGIHSPSSAGPLGLLLLLLLLLRLSFGWSFGKGALGAKVARLLLLTLLSTFGG